MRAEQPGLSRLGHELTAEAVLEAVGCLSVVALAGYHDVADEGLGARFEILHPIGEGKIDHRFEPRQG